MNIPSTGPTSLPAACLKTATQLEELVNVSIEAATLLADLREVNVLGSAGMAKSFEKFRVVSFHFLGIAISRHMRRANG